MATLRSKVDASTSQQPRQDEPKDTEVTAKGSMTWIIFIGLLIDLLAFTLILPLFPALLEHYRKVRSSEFQQYSTACIASKWALLPILC